MNNQPVDSNERYNNLELQPFGGRQAVFERIQQYLVDPADRHALLFIGRQSIGKTALLKQCLNILGSNVIGCYLPLSEIDFTSETNWLFYLIQQTNQMLESQDLNITRLPDLPDDVSLYRESILEDYLTELSKLIRPHRRFIWLMDDVNYLIEAIENDKLPQDILDYFLKILETHLQIGIVMTLEENDEPRVNALAPLVDINHLQRLHPLSESEATHLITQFTDHTTTPIRKTIYQWTDGHPLLLQLVGQELQTIYHAPITEEDLNTIFDKVYKQANDTYRTIWHQSLSQNERIVLTAISGLLYQDPFVNLTAQRIESWLLETDFPMDITAINASIRGLEYRDLVAGSTAEGIRLRAKLFQRWLIENARMTDASGWNKIPDDSNIPQLDRRSILFLAIAIIIIIMIVIMLQQSNITTSIPVQPTVTLGN